MLNKKGTNHNLQIQQENREISILLEHIMKNKQETLLIALFAPYSRGLQPKVAQIKVCKVFWILWISFILICIYISFKPKMYRYDFFGMNKTEIYREKVINLHVKLFFFYFSQSFLRSTSVGWHVFFLQNDFLNSFQYS